MTAEDQIREWADRRLGVFPALEVELKVERDHDGMTRGEDYREGVDRALREVEETRRRVNESPIRAWFYNGNPDTRAYWHQDVAVAIRLPDRTYIKPTVDTLRGHGLDRAATIANALHDAYGHVLDRLLGPERQLALTETITHISITDTGWQETTDKTAGHRAAV